jgi:predicted AAA+ superfamily ATPase
MKKIHERYLKEPVTDDLKERMVFIGGPRQVGKATFALTFLSEPTVKHPAYLNWDNVTTRSSLLRGELPPKEKCIVFDEIHKFGKWRNLVKGFYDTKNQISHSTSPDQSSSSSDILQRTPTTLNFPRHRILPNYLDTPIFF